ncbi:hypothetical protein [Natrarchaeobius chitinivorans]|uniref:Uncharacterized protein n=1 Tax=Natrarchaeobius chitinivorans TaxID=1679083 RepID=A0A3N6MLI4_NATCH|nr:hypothetical protein [Natrarchaeobius chitinivorans]RQG95206.1 hypothetical protein EA473_09695 [Natrarchaeobius chitinivorans]
MGNTVSPSNPVRLAIDVIVLVVLSLVLLFGGTQTGIVLPTFTWVTVVLVSVGFCSGFLFWRYSTTTERGLISVHLSGYPLVVALIAIFVFGLLWIAFVPPLYGDDLIYGLLTQVWTVFVLMHGN